MDAARQYLPPVEFPVARRSVDLGSRRMELFQAADPNAVADAVTEEDFAEDERFPYWAELWPSGVALAAFLWRRGSAAGRDVVELGCGLGVAGVAAALGGARVVFTDYEPEALGFARANHALNLGEPGRTRLVDWREPPADLEASLVLAADVLYERRFFEPFLATLRRVVRPGGTAYVAEPGRDIARGTVERLELDGFDRDLHLEEGTLADRPYAVWIHELHRSSG